MNTEQFTTMFSSLTEDLALAEDSFYIQVGAQTTAYDILYKAGKSKDEAKAFKQAMIDMCKALSGHAAKVAKSEEILSQICKLANEPMPNRSKLTKIGKLTMERVNEYNNAKAASSGARSSKPETGYNQDNLQKDLQREGQEYAGGIPIDIHDDNRAINIQLGPDEKERLAHRAAIEKLTRGKVRA